MTKGRCAFLVDDDPPARSGIDRLLRYADHDIRDYAIEGDEEHTASTWNTPGNMPRPQRGEGGYNATATEENMNKATVQLTLIALAIAVAAPCLADDLTGSEHFLCSSSQATVCDVTGECEVGPPWSWNIPQFIEVDLEAKKLSTTEASGENRETPIKNLERADGMVFLQGVERGRAFSVVIEEETGMLTASMTKPDAGVTLFGACTPLPSAR